MNLFWRIPPDANIREEGYAEDYVESLEKAILYLHVFLDVYNLGYDSEIANAWISCNAIEAVFRGKSSLDSAKRMLNLFHDYAVSGECHLDIVYRNRPSQIETLPSWCRPAVEAFIEQRKLEKFEKNTIVSDGSALFRFCSFIVDNGVTSYADVTGELVAAFNINDAHKSSSGKNNYNCKIRRFLKYLAREGLINNPSVYLLLGATAAPYESIVTTLTPEEIEIARSYIDNASTPTEIRDSAMFMLGADMGLRGVDIAGLRISDVDLVHSCLKLRQEKNDKDVELSIPTDVGNIIFRYLRDVRPKPCKTDFLFVGIYKSHQRIRRGVCYDALHRILPDRDVPGSGFHVTRKTFATNRLQNGADPMEIADCMGSDPRSLTPYFSLDAEHMSMCPISLEALHIPMERSLLC
ncbi:MAG: tyrosine-type recombinase/integrase [Oscillospiraceae bacterium]|nr:tyrosine-type recombinase/integrase [Clostridia bacterium]MBR0341778.1 tyrosine-type recombinase/integrase [Oscillospiraceae bacterium]